MIEQVELEKRVVLRVKFILDGADPRGAVFQDRHFYRWTLANEAPPGEGIEWRVVKDELIEGLRVAGDGGGFREVAPAASGIDFKHSRDPKLDASTIRQDKFDIIEHARRGSAVDSTATTGRTSSSPTACAAASTATSPTRPRAK